MRMDRISRIICHVMAIILLLSGVCFYIVRTHSSFKYLLDNHVESLEGKKYKVISRNNDISDIFEQYIEELEDDNDIRDIRSKSNLEAFQYLHLWKVFLQNPTNSCMALVCGQNETCFFNTSIIRYIHHSDGKK